jgi:DNA-binding MarR family transcriptional regulator
LILIDKTLIKAYTYIEDKFNYIPHIEYTLYICICQGGKMLKKYSDKEILEFFLYLSNQLRRKFNAKLEERYTPKDLSFQRVRALLEISSFDGIKMSDLAKNMDVRSRTVTDYVDSLEKNGYVERVPDGNDRRAILLRLTPKAEELVETMHNAMKIVTAELFSPLTVEQQHQLYQILTLLNDELNRE